MFLANGALFALTGSTTRKSVRMNWLCSPCFLFMPPRMARAGHRNRRWLTGSSGHAPGLSGCSTSWKPPVLSRDPNDRQRGDAGPLVYTRLSGTPRPSRARHWPGVAGLSTTTMSPATVSQGWNRNTGIQLSLDSHAIHTGTARVHP
jgi:hypothetical protein